MHIEDWPLVKIRPYPNNPRVLRNAAEKVAESIRAFGWRQPIVVDADGVIVAGHGRYAAAQLLKLKKAPVHVAKDLTPEQVRALRIADNKTASFSEWDDQKLADELAEILSGVGDIAITGFSQSEFDALEMRTRAELARLEPPAVVGLNPPEVEREQVEASPEVPEVGDQDGGAPAAPQEVLGQQAEPMVPFNVLMTVDARQVVFDAVAKAKRDHGLETTADALLVIARRFVDA